MKIEFEIPDIKREEVIEAMAGQLLTEWHEDGDGDRYRRETKIGKAVKRHLDDKIAELAAVLVREQFDVVVKDRIGAAVDAVLAEGWSKTDSYGCAIGPKIDLKGRISEVLTKPVDTYDRTSLVDKKLKEAVSNALDKSFAAEIEVAKKKVRAEIDGLLTGKVTEAIKSAMGLK